MHQLLQVVACGSQCSHDDVCADSLVGREVAVWVFDVEIAGGVLCAELGEGAVDDLLGGLIGRRLAGDGAGFLVDRRREDDDGDGTEQGKEYCDQRPSPHEKENAQAVTKVPGAEGARVSTRRVLRQRWVDRGMVAEVGLEPTTLRV